MLTWKITRDILLNCNLCTFCGGCLLVIFFSRYLFWHKANILKYSVRMNNSIWEKHAFSAGIKMNRCPCTCYYSKGIIFHFHFCLWMVLAHYYVSINRKYEWASKPVHSALNLLTVIKTFFKSKNIKG